MILIQKILFNQQECQSIIDITKLKKQNWNYKDRIYESMSIEYNENTIWLFDKLKDFVEKETNIKIGIIKKTIHFHRFVKGDWFGKHNDIRNNRLYAVGVLLNDNFQGGDFKLYNPTEQTLDKVIGNTYLFDVRIEHKITPILDGERFSLLWFLQNEHIKTTTNTLI
jgi:hypothetical protein